MDDLIIPAKTLEQLKISPSELLVDLAMHLYDKEKLSMGQAKKLAGLPQIAFQKERANRDLYIKYSVEDFETDLKNLSLLD